MAKNIAIDAQSALKKELNTKADHYDTTQLRIEARFGCNVRWYRKQRHLTQDQLGFLCGLNQNYISEIERGQRNVTLRVMDLIAKALGISADELIR